MAHLTPQAHALLARQHGCITPDQLLGAGHRPSAVKRLVAVGTLELVMPGVYRTPSATWNEQARSAAVCLARPEVAIADVTAGRHWEFRRLPKDRRIFVVTPPGQKPSIAPWVVPYRTAAIHPADVVVLGDGRRITSRQRTVLDLARRIDAGDVLSLIEQARHDGKVSIDQMIAVAADWRSPQRRWLRTYLEQVGRCLPGGPAESHEEVQVGSALVAAGVRGLQRQFAIDLPGRSGARFDLAVPAVRLAIEVDMFPEHHTFEGRRRDAERDRKAAEQGWVTTRLGPDAFGRDFDRRIAEIATLASSMRRAA